MKSKYLIQTLLLVIIMSSAISAKTSESSNSASERKKRHRGSDEKGKNIQDSKVTTNDKSENIELSKQFCSTLNNLKVNKLLLKESEFSKIFELDSEGKATGSLVKQIVLAKDDSITSPNADESDNDNAKAADKDTKSKTDKDQQLTIIDDTPLEINRNEYLFWLTNKSKLSNPHIIKVEALVQSYISQKKNLSIFSSYGYIFIPKTTGSLKELLGYKPVQQPQKQVKVSKSLAPKNLNPFETFIFYAVQLARGLDYLHNKLGIVLYDIKPSNILYSLQSSDEENVNKVMFSDFGNALKKSSKFIKFNSVGSRRFSAPEIFLNQSRLFGTEIDEKTDIYSLGSIYLLLLKKDAIPKDFRNSSTTDDSSILLQLDNDTYGNFIQEDTTNPGRKVVVQLINNMLNRNPNKRYAINKIMKLLENLVSDRVKKALDVIASKNTESDSSLQVCKDIEIQIPKEEFDKIEKDYQDQCLLSSFKEEIKKDENQDMKKEGNKGDTKIEFEIGEKNSDNKSRLDDDANPNWLEDYIKEDKA